MEQIRKGKNPIANVNEGERNGARMNDQSHLVLSRLGSVQFDTEPEILIKAIRTSRAAVK